MKNKLLILLMLALLGLMLNTDIGLLLSMQEKPQLFSEVSGFSYVHFLLLDVYRFEFAVFKLAFTLLILLFWLAQLFGSRGLLLLRQLTASYVLFWLMLLTLVATSIAGILQQVAGIPVDLLNPIPVLLVAAGGYPHLLLYVAVGLSAPVLLFVFSTFYVARNR